MKYKFHCCNLNKLHMTCVLQQSCCDLNISLETYIQISFFLAYIPASTADHLLTYFPVSIFPD